MNEVQSMQMCPSFGIRKIAPGRNLAIALVDTWCVLLLKCSPRDTKISSYIPELPPVGQLAVESRGTWLSQSSREWLLLAPKERADPLCRQLLDKIAPASAVIVDVSDAITIVSLSGSQGPALLAKGSGFQTSHVSSGLSTRIRLANIGVGLAMLPNAPTIYLLTERYHASYLWAWLSLASTGVNDEA